MSAAALKNHLKIPHLYHVRFLARWIFCSIKSAGWDIYIHPARLVHIPITNF